MTPEERALDYMRRGWGSRASVFMAVTDHFGVDLDMTTRKWICLAIDPFHGPSGSLILNGKRFGINICGALAGALSAFNIVYATPDMLPYEFWTEGMREGGWVRRLIDENRPIEEKVRVFLNMCERYGYGAHHEMVRRFYHRFGTTDCYDLCRQVGDPVSYQCFKNCAKVVCWTAGMAVGVIEAFRENPERFRISKEHAFWRIVEEAKAQSGQGEGC